MQTKAGVESLRESVSKMLDNDKSHKGTAVVKVQ